MRPIFLAFLVIASTSAQQCGRDFGRCSGQKCCSQYGWCGVNTDYCQNGCQSRYGLCGQLSLPSAPAPNAGTSTSDCGPSNDGKRCATGLCCSQWGWCGATANYCASGCQIGWGDCQSTFSSARGQSSLASSVARISSSKDVSSSIGVSSCKILSSSRIASSSDAYSSFKTASSVLSSVKSSSFAASASVRGLSSTGLAGSSSKLSSASPVSAKSSSSTDSLSQSSTAVASSLSRSTTSSVQSSAGMGSSSIKASSVLNSAVISVSSSAAKGSAVLSIVSPEFLSLSSSKISTSSQSSLSSSSSVFSSTVAFSVVTRSSSQQGISTNGAASSVASSSSKLQAYSSSALPPLSVSSILSTSAVSSTIPATSASVSPSPGTKRSVFPNGDPLSDPNAITLSTTSNTIQGSLITVSDAHSGATCLRAVSLPPGGATLEAATSASITAGVSYTVSVWVRSVGSAGCTASIVVGVSTVATSGNNVPTTWTLISGPYTSTTDATPAIKLVVTCPPRSTKRKRQLNDPGMDLDDLDMTTTVAVSASQSVDITSSNATLPVSLNNAAATSVISVSATSEVQSLSSATSSSITLSSAVNSTITISSVVNPLSSSVAVNGTLLSLSESISTITSSASLASATASYSSANISSSISNGSCDPILLDGSFEVAGLAWDGTTGVGTSDEWGPWQRRNTDDPDSYQSSPFFAPHNGSYGYAYFNPSYAANSFVLQYKHPINFCPNVMYQFGLWLRSYKSGSSASAGCRVTGLLNGKGIFSDRPGSWDTLMRYVGTATSFPAATSASLALSFSCTGRTVTDLTYRRTVGAYIDDIDIATAANFVTPITLSSQTVVLDSATSTFPLTAPCTPTNFGTLTRSCAHVGEWLENRSFEECDITSWTFDKLVNFDEANSGIVSDEAHTGSKSLKTVFTANGGALGVKVSRLLWACEDRDFRVSYAVKGASSYCKVEHWWGGLLWKSTQLGSSAWQVVDYTIYDPVPTIKQANPSANPLGTFELRITCTSGGATNAVYLDDLSLQQLPYNPVNPPTVPETPQASQSFVLAGASPSASASAVISSLAASSSTTSASACRPTIDDGSFELAGSQGEAADWRPYVPSGSSFVTTGPSSDYHREGNYAYVISTNYNDSNTFNQAINTNYYPKGLSLCANTTYQIGWWTTGYSHDNIATIGCFAGLYVVDRVVVRDVSGPADVGNWRYVGASFTVSADYATASMGISLACERTNVANGYRGYVIDQISIAPAAEFVPPPTPTMSTYTTPVPSNYNCDPLLYSRPPMSCVTYGELLSNKGWEDCFNADHDYTYSDADLYNQFWPENAGAKSEDVHSGRYAQKIVILRPNGYWGITFGGFRSCPYRKYQYSFWAKQYSGDCKVQVIWGGVVFAEHVPPTSRTPGQGWVQFSGIITNPFQTAPDQFFELRGTCSIGGSTNPLFIDDASLTQVPGVTI